MAEREGPCIVCGHDTADRTATTGRSHWRCSDGEDCAVRRNARKRRPKPEADVRRAWREAHPRTYIGERHGDSGLTRVLVDDGDVRAPLEHHVRHSPTGFEWGYGGSGPSDLARCILIDHFDSWLRTDPLEGALRNYQQFKFDVIALLPREGFELTSLQVQSWIDAHKAEWGEVSS